MEEPQSYSIEDLTVWARSKLQGGVPALEVETSMRRMLEAQEWDANIINQTVAEVSGRLRQGSSKGKERAEPMATPMAAATDDRMMTMMMAMMNRLLDERLGGQGPAGPPTLSGATPPP